MAKRRKQDRKKTIFGIAVMSLLILMMAALLIWTKPPTTQLTWRGGPLREGRVTQAQDEAVPLCDKMMVVKWQSYGRKMVVQCSVSAKPETDKRNELKNQVKKQERRIKDKVRHAIGSVAIEDLRDPQLTMVKRDIKQSVCQVVGNGMIRDILIPEWYTSRWY
jgi:flagellar basal body-associated protein FliL